MDVSLIARSSEKIAISDRAEKTEWEVNLSSNAPNELGKRAAPNSL